MTRDAAQGRLIAFRADRLGARLVSLMNTMRLAETLDAPFACAWTETAGVGDVFNDPAELFDQAFVDRHFLTDAEWARVRPAATQLRPQAAGSAEQIAATLAGGTDTIVGNAFGVINLMGEDPAAVTPAFRAQLERIPFTAPVARALAAADSALAGHTAYHIRRGDLTGDLKAMNRPWPHKMVPDEFYEMHMRTRLGAAGGVLLFSDDAGTIAHYRAAFPTLKTVADVIDMGTLTEAQRDLVEMYAMGRCDTIIAPERSAFSSTAADLFGAEKRAVTEALTEDELDQAHQTLMDRLETRPESFPSAGDIGQSLAHVGPWLERKGRWQDAARMQSDLVRGGLNISFIYPRTMTCQHRAGDIDGVLETANLMDGRHIVHVKDKTDAEALHGLAHLRAGDRDAGLRHIANAWWHVPAGRLARNIVPLMVELGWYTHRNFLPVTALHRALQRRRGPVKALAEDLPGIDALPGVELPLDMSRLDALSWDWAPLLRSVSTTAIARSGAVERMQQTLRKVTVTGAHEAEMASQVAILQAFAGDSSAAETLDTLARAHPGAWQIWQRLSHVHWLERRFDHAAETAERAVECLPDAPVLAAWAGLLQMRARQFDSALDNLETADAANIGLPSIPHLHARTLMLNGMAEEALPVIRRARTLAPQHAVILTQEAEILEALDDMDGAIALLAQLVEWQIAPGKAFIHLITLLQDLGRTAEAAEFARIAEARFPKQPRLAELGRTLAA